MSRTQVAARTDGLEGTMVLLAAAGLLTVVAIAMTAVDGLHEANVAVAFGVMIAIGELVRLRLPGDRVQAPIGFAGGLGYALLSDLAGKHLMHSTTQVVAVVAVAMVVGLLPHVIAGRPPELEATARRLLVIAAVAAVYRPLVLGPDSYRWLDTHRPLFILLTIVVVAVAWVLEAALAAGTRANRAQAPFWSQFRNELTAMLGIGAAIASTGVLIVLAAWEIGLWALPIFSMPLLLAQISYRRYAAIRQTQIQTIRALSRSTEVAGYTETGHARRVATLAVAMARQRGLSDERLRTLEYAALMHDIGQLSLTDPIPGGATVLLNPDERRELAMRGAEIIKQTGVLEDVARIVGSQSEPYRRPHVPDDVNVPLESRIIKVANAYDDLVGGSDDDAARTEALERLRLGMAYEYDPRVIESLARIVDRRN